VLNRSHWKELEKQIQGDVLFDEVSLMLYSTDASLFQVFPKGIVVPKNGYDVSKAILFAAKNGLAITPRGAGSGLAGQALGTGLILDFTKYFNKIVSFDLDKKEITVQPGVLLGDLNRYLAEYGLFLPPDPSSADYCTVGGCISNNSSGAHSCKYGNFDRYTVGLKIILEDGLEVEIKPVTKGKEWEEMIGYSPTLKEVGPKIVSIAEENKELMEEHFPKVDYNVAGYAGLKQIVSEEGIDLIKLFVGSEGTLGVITQITLRAIEKPKFLGLGLIFFDDVVKAGEAVVESLKFDPAYVEIMDSQLIDMARTEYSEIDELIPESVSYVVMVEFDGDDENEIFERSNKLEKKITKANLALKYTFATDTKQREELFTIRKAAVPLMYKVPGKRKVIAVIEDCAVPTETLPRYFQGLIDIFEKYDMNYCIYGHAGKGLLHTRPILDIRDGDEIDAMNKIQDDVFNLAVNELKGTMSGEHGDGRIRSRYLPQTYGPVYDLMVEIKQMLDPDFLFNPENKRYIGDDLDEENWRFGRNYSRHELKGRFFEDQQLVQEEIMEIIELCHGCSTCTATDPVLTMCPVYRYDLDERSSPKAKANLLRGVLAGDLSADILFTKEAIDVFNRCLNCDSCRIQCPSNVNIPFIAQLAKANYYETKKWPLKPSWLQRWFLANYYTVGKLSRPFAKIINWTLKRKIVRQPMYLLFNIHHKITFPPFDGSNFLKEANVILNPPDKPKAKVAFFYGCFSKYNEPEVGLAMIDLFQKMEIEVVIPEQQCCGIPMLSNGHLKKAISSSEKNFENFKGYLEGGYSIVSTCSSCSHMLRHTVPHELLPRKEIKNLSEDNVFHWSEYLLKLEKEGIIEKMDFSAIDPELILGYHHSCHLRSQPTAVDSTVSLLERVPKLELTVFPDRCCGIIGSYGFKKEGYDNAMYIGQTLFDDLNNGLTHGLSDCPTCKTQMNHGADIPTIHPILLVYESYLKL
jgi:anaerobic glycerol-3-phosphate dehydrogenase C subunit